LLNLRVSPASMSSFQKLPAGDYFAHYHATILPELLDQLVKHPHYTHYCGRRVSQAFDFAAINNTGGAPSFAHFAKGGSGNVRTTGRTHVVSAMSPYGSCFLLLGIKPNSTIAVTFFCRPLKSNG